MHKHIYTSNPKASKLPDTFTLKAGTRKCLSIFIRFLLKALATVRQGRKLRHKEFKRSQAKTSQSRKENKKFSEGVCCKLMNKNQPSYKQIKQKIWKQMSIYYATERQNAHNKCNRCYSGDFG